MVIDPIEVPKDLSEKGYTPQVVAQRIAAEISTLQRAARTRARQEEGIELSATQLDFTVPSAGISYRGLIRYVRQLFGLPEQRVSGEIVREARAIRIALRARDGHTTPSHLWVASEAELPELFRKAAIEIARLVTPYLVATYWFGEEQRKHRFEKTFEAVRACLARSPAGQHHRAYVIWGNALVLQRQFDEADEKFRTAAGLELGSASTYNSCGIPTWGDLLLERKRPREALPLFTRAGRLDPCDGLAWADRGRALRQLKHYASASKAYEWALALRSTNHTWLTELGELLQEQGRHVEAIARFGRALESNPWSDRWGPPRIAHMLVDSLRQLSHLEQAIAHYRETEPEGSPSTRCDALIGRGFILVYIGQYSAAAEKFRKALAIDPGHPAAQQGLADVREALKKPDAQC